MSSVDWSKSISIAWDEKLRENSVVAVPGTKVPAGPPTVQSRRAVWEVSSVYPRVFGAAYRFPLDTVAVNRGLKDGRGRTLVARAVEEPSGQMPVAVLGWHLSQRVDDPLLVTAASPRLPSGVSPMQEIVIETGFRLLVDALLYVASDHRAWVLARLPARSRERKRVEEQLGGLLFDVEGQGGLARYLRELYGARLSVSARKGGAPRQLRLRA
ncbi:MAG TPA: hypothetical protein VES65_05300 [Solirubrobacteraceae bacterium]|nr:hypothetical protein [Solirubrobacteraceae bacterium]